MKAHSACPSPLCGGGWRAERAGRGEVRLSTAPLPTLADARATLSRRGRGQGACSLFVLNNRPNLGYKVRVCRPRGAPEASVVAEDAALPLGGLAHQPTEGSGAEDEGSGHRSGGAVPPPLSLARTGANRGCANRRRKARP